MRKVIVVFIVTLLTLACSLVQVVSTPPAVATRRPTFTPTRPRTSTPAKTETPTEKPTLTAIPTDTATSAPTDTPSPADTQAPRPTARPRPANTPTMPPVVAPALIPQPAATEPTLRPASSGCCKHCSKGKACGDACIAKNEVCTDPPGCACDQ